ncbi:hypothetical protein FRB93_000211 [Tulasnella sp. JGI-2019a]|nr:hypothetical protein FRB93_000211 [Tulasnella sp. JGI-2019a]
MSVVREELIASASHMASASIVAGSGARTTIVGGATSKLAMREAVSSTAMLAENSGSVLSSSVTRMSTQTTSRALLSGAQAGAESSTLSMLARAGEGSTVGGLLTKGAEPELSFVLREAISNASQQGVEETLDQARPQVSMVMQAAATEVRG